MPLYLEQLETPAPVVDREQLETLGYEPIPDDDPDAETYSYGGGPR